MKLSLKQANLIEKVLASQDKSFKLDTHLFNKQLAFIKDPSRRKTAVTTRRSGKSTACAADLVYTCLLIEKATCVYITLTRGTAERLLWPMVKELVEKHDIDVTFNESKLSVTFHDTGSILYLSGASDKAEIEKYRGLSLTKVYLDEAQSFPPFIEALVYEVLEPALADQDGTLVLIGTPGPVPVGYFYNVSHDLNADGAPIRNSPWRHHFWSIVDNPWIKIKSKKEPMQLINEACQARGVTYADPKIQREYFGQWANDPDSLVYKYNDSVNHYDGLPNINGSWNYVFGVDLGFDDADAIAVLAYSTAHPAAFLVEEMIQTKQGITDLAKQIEALAAKYKPEQIVIDTGANGKKIAFEINSRYQLGIQPADKTRKFENIELLNDAMRTGKFFAKTNSRFAHDTKKVEWDIDKKRPDRLVVSDKFHSDITDAVLYAFRTLYHWMYKPEPYKPKPGELEHYKQIEEEMEAAAEERLLNEQQEDDFVTGDDIWGKGL